MRSVEGILVHSGRAVEIHMEDGVIQQVNSIERKDDLPYISPGFLDMQVNGYNGSDFSLEEFTRDHIDSIQRSLAKAGTSRFVPTFVSMPHERMLRNLEITRKAVRKSSLLSAAIPGFHIEGPFISREDGPRGAHDSAFVCNPNIDYFHQWQEAADGMVRYITLAPEREGAMDFIKQVTASGVKVSIGHSGCSPEQIREAVEAGATLSTHLGNGSHSTVPRLKNYLWEQLAADELYAGMISDGFHLPASVVKVFARAKGLKRVILVSDVALIGGYPPGLYKWGNLEVEVFEDGHLGLHGTTFLAGAAHLLDWDILRFMESTGASLSDTIKLCTENPSVYLGLSESGYGDARPDIPVNLTVFRYVQGDARLRVEKTLLQEAELWDSARAAGIVHG